MSGGINYRRLVEGKTRISLNPLAAAQQRIDALVLDLVDLGERNQRVLEEIRDLLRAATAPETETTK